MMRTAFLPSLLLLGACLQAQESGKEAPRPSVGFRLANLDGDFAFGLESTSRYFLNGSLAFRGSIETAGRRGFPVNAPERMTWASYPVAKAGVVGVGGMVGNGIRLYGEGGVLAAFPRKSFSSDSTRIGGYGHFGFEFLWGRPGHALGCYFIELGSVRTDARADRQVGEPFYLNGFTVGTGIRIFL